MISEERKAEIRDTGIMAGMTTAEIRDFLDEEFKAALLGPRKDLSDRVGKLRWLVGHALPYAESDGLFQAVMRRAEHQENRMSYAFVNMSGGVIQHDQYSDDIESFVIDWDEVKESLAYAKEKWIEVNTLTEVPPNLIHDVKNGLLDEWPSLDSGDWS